MDFELSQEHKLFRQAIKTFVEKEIAPVVDASEETQTFPVELFRKAGNLGYLCPAYPSEYGGGGLGETGKAILVEEVARACSGIAAGFMIHGGLGTSMLMARGDAGQKERFLVPAIKGRKIAGFAMTEPNAGSDAAAIETTATRDGDYYVLNGTKVYVTNGPICDFITTSASTDRSKGSRGISVFIIEAGTPGVEIRKQDKLGHHSAATAEVFLTDCRVPASNMVGQEGDGWRALMAALAPGRVAHAARSLGVAQAALDSALGYAKTRVQFGQPIGKNQAISFRLARMATDVEAARWMVYRAAWLLDNGDRARKEASMAKFFSSEVAVRVAESAMRIFAGAGYMAEAPVQRYYRDAILFPSTEGTNEIQQMVIAGDLGL